MYYFKESLFLFVYSITMSFLSFISLVIETVVWQYVISFASIAFYIFIMYYYMLQVGKKATEQLFSNDTLRKRIVETGDDIKINTMVEYSWFKGFLMGSGTCVPMALLLLIHLIIVLAGGETVILGGIANFLYMVFSAPILIIAGDSLSKWTYFIELYGLILSSVISGVAYIFGGRKAFLQHQKIIEKQRSIYGE